MSDSNDSNNYSGLVSCIDSFNGAYCIRKGIQFAVSTLLIVTSLILLIIFLNRYCCQKYVWITSTMLLMVSCLIANMMFCWFNQDYWLFALETYFFNLYYLSIVGYVCKSYLLKYRQNTATGIVQKLMPSHLIQNGADFNYEKIVFYSVFVAMSVLYTAIFISSIIFEAESDLSEQTHAKYCQQIWYLCFQVLCILLSIIVMIIMYRHQKQQGRRLQEYEQLYNRRSVGSVLSRESMLSQEKVSNVYPQSQINNPLSNLWIWIILNVISQVVNLVQSGLFLQASPPQCLIVQKNPNESNIMQLIFVFLTMYLGFIGTLWYVFMISKTKQKSLIDRTVHFSDQIRVNGNIQLFFSSREQTITPLL